MQEKTQETHEQTDNNTKDDKALRSRSVKKHKTKLAAIVAAVAVIIVAALLLIFNHQHQQAVEQFSFETILDVSDYVKELDDTWTTHSEKPSVSEAKIESDRGFPGYSFVIYFYKAGTNRITLSKGDEKTVFNVTVSEDKQINIYPE